MDEKIDLILAVTTFEPKHFWSICSNAKIPVTDDDEISALLVAMTEYNLIKNAGVGQHTVKLSTFGNDVKTKYGRWTAYKAQTSKINPKTRNLHIDDSGTRQTMTDIREVILKYLYDKKGRTVDLSVALQPFDRDRIEIRDILTNLKKTGLININPHYISVANLPNGQYQPLNLCSLGASITDIGERYYIETYLPKTPIIPDNPSLWAIIKNFFQHSNNVVGTIVGVATLLVILGILPQTCQNKEDQSSPSTKSTDSTQILSSPKLDSGLNPALNDSSQVKAK